MSAADASAFEGHEELVAELRANRPVAPDRLRDQVLAVGQERRRPSRRRLVLVVVPVAVAAAVGAALVHGFVSSGSHEASLRANPRVPGALSITKRSVQHGSAQGAPLSGSSAAAESALKTPNSFSRYALNIPRNRLVHADASLEVQVKTRSALSKATNSATQIVSSLGGYAQSVRYQSSHSGSGTAFLTLRVPVQKAQTAIAKLGQLGHLVSQQISTQDLQQQLTHETNQIGSLKRAIVVYETALKSGSLSATERVAIQIKLANAEHALTLQRKARQGTVTYGSTANISLVLSTNKNSFAVGPHKRGRLGRLLHDAAGFLGLEGIIVLYALIVAGPVLLLGGLGWWLVRERRRREESRLLASA
jgi:Domain of unknown function (DUF4349)